ncbi:MAG: hypothetical protein WAV20_20040 [Blastocatellia bacterium]
MNAGTEKQRRLQSAYDPRASPVHQPAAGHSGARRFSILLAIAFSLLLGSAVAQTRKKTPPRKSEASLSDRVAKAKAQLIVAANDYKASLEALQALQENDVKALTETLEKRKALLEQSIISKKEVDESEQTLLIAQGRVAATAKQLADTDNLIAEAKAEEQLAKLGPSRLGSYQTTAALIRYNGAAHWVLADASKVESFFVSKFRHALPISAYGQTAVHDHLNFDHRNSIDVAVSPDSSEGQTLMAYLRAAGIPFIAFRHAVAGSATGAHIHIGYPSKRMR